MEVNTENTLSKFLYIVDYWVPFPASEYGGTINVVAADNVECHDLLRAWRDECDSKYDSGIMESVSKAQVFELANDEPSEVVSTFTT